MDYIELRSKISREMSVPYPDVSECPEPGKMPFGKRPDCQALLQLIGRNNAKYHWSQKLYFGHLDLRRIYFYNKHHDTFENDLSGAFFKGANIGWTVLAGINLSNANFNHVRCAKNAWFDNAILTNASFYNADLRGINRKYDYDGTGKEIIGNLNPVIFGDTKTLYKAKLDPWLENYIEDKFPHLLEPCEEPQ